VSGWSFRVGNTFKVGISLWMNSIKPSRGQIYELSFAFVSKIARNRRADTRLVGRDAPLSHRPTVFPFLHLFMHFEPKTLRRFHLSSLSFGLSRPTTMMNPSDVPRPVRPDSGLLRPLSVSRSRRSLTSARLDSADDDVEQWRWRASQAPSHQLDEDEDHLLLHQTVLASKKQQLEHQHERVRHCS
jgi:hypothetical protein